MASLADRVRRLLGREDVLPIARRYFVSNGFDGTLTSIGIVVGALLSGVPDGATVIKIGLGAAVGLCTSAVWSVWEIERAETRAEILELERAMLTDLDDTRIQRERSGARALHAVASGLGPLIGVLIPLSPFLFEGSVLAADLLSMREAAIAGVGLGIGVLGAFGAYMGSISGQRWYVAAVRMGLAGLVVAVINIFLPG
jgi:predicted membrane protein (TIGR00267 family)